ncbi:dienelactone hydrolase family protein [Aquisalimonas lutea]|uniref:alpha/beta hydrolase n=1 Tax=Aquisalimonas lutea TaxID=1327750 RepID=UPI0025B3B0D1|nr:dienelactone hydrolase family protein [Aquisalimonas lutea]MDN3516655.1 dienelactone hydrolase family protein [Aquisalimonas lutea]
MSEELLECVEAGAGGEAKASVIWLHGLGADGHDFEPIVPELRLPASLPVRFIFPHAPVRPVTLNGGMAMRAWYDIIALGGNAQQDEQGIRQSEAQVHALIRRENERGIATGRIVLAGFSQGGAVALHTGVRYPEQLAGIMGLSTYLPLADSVAAERSGANAQTPVFMAHGTEDPVLPIQLGQRSHEHLQALGYAVEWHDYPMQHAVCLEEIQAIGAWLQQVLAPA